MKDISRTTIKHSRSSKISMLRFKCMLRKTELTSQNASKMEAKRNVSVSYQHINIILINYSLVSFFRAVSSFSIVTNKFSVRSALLPTIAKPFQTYIISWQKNKQDNLMKLHIHLTKENTLGECYGTFWKHENTAYKNLF